MGPPSREVLDALRDLSARYASAVDRRDLPRLLEAFHPDAELVVRRDGDAQPTPMRGHDEIGRIIERIGRYQSTFHLLGQARYELDGDAATGEVYCIAHHISAGSDEADATDQVLLVRYLDDYRMATGGAWKISHRTVHVDAAVVHPMPPTTPATKPTPAPSTQELP